MKKYLLIVVLLAAVCAGSIVEIDNRMLQKGIAGQVIRFHVLANSDTTEDQQMKMQVKECMVAYLEEMLSDCDSVEESRELILNHQTEIKQKADHVLETLGVSLSTEVCLAESWFPEKTYGDCTFPAGMYEALQVKIGNALGHNWWCVLYPGLCFEQSVRGVVTERGKEQLRHVLTDEEMDVILKNRKVNIRFRWF